MSSQLFYRDTYTDKNISYLANQVIIEYDLKSANTNLCKEYQLLPMEEIEKIESLPKKERVVKIGKLMRKNPTFKEGLKKAFVDIRRRFFEDNEIEDNEILSIKKDAIFCLKTVKKTEFGYCKFVKKNEYTSYLYLNQLELYYGSKDTWGGEHLIEVKGIDDEVIKKHKDGMMKFFYSLFYQLEENSKVSQMRFLRKTIDQYIGRQLPIDYYREFNSFSVFYLLDREESYDNPIFIPYADKEQCVDISYNFNKILLPIISMMI